jgi:hypothetical protein
MLSPLAALGGRRLHALQYLVQLTEATAAEILPPSALVEPEVAARAGKTARARLVYLLLTLLVVVVVLVVQAIIRQVEQVELVVLAQVSVPEVTLLRLE